MAFTRLSLNKHISRLKVPRLNRENASCWGTYTLAICAVIAGANTWTDIETFGPKRLDWLRRFLELPNGIPSHDTLQKRHPGKGSIRTKRIRAALDVDFLEGVLKPGD